MRTLIAILLFISIVAAQTQRPTSREIVAEDFTRNRSKPSASDAGGGTLSSAPGTSAPSSNSSGKKERTEQTRRKRLYRLATTNAAAGSGKPTKVLPSRDPAPSSGALGLVQLGVTIWRLRPARQSDTGARMLVMEDSNAAEWVAERIEADTPIGVGDRIRISIESPRSGYLYIVDRDLFADGSKGDAMLIFPTLGTNGGDNVLKPGKLIDIPGQDDRQSYFTAKPVRSDQVGEVLSIIVSTTPLPLPLHTKAVKVSAEDLTEWEDSWGVSAERFEMLGGAGQEWTNEEKQAAGKSGARQLTQDDPSPQTIYRIRTHDKKPFLVNVTLRYGR